MDLLTWATLYRPKLSPDRLFDLKKHEYLIDMYRCDARQMVVQKAGQVCISEMAVSKSLYACDILKANVFYLMPTSKDVSDFSQNRFGPAIEASAYLTGIIVDASKDGRRGTDKVTMKRIRNNFIVFRGGKIGANDKASQLKSIPADFLIRDEVDEMDIRAKEISRKRLGHSHLKMELAISTPTFPGVGINEEFEDSSQCEWMIPCPSCGYKQIMTIDHMVIEWDDNDIPLAWYGQDVSEAWLACEKCHAKLNRTVGGEWVPAYSSREIVGFHPTQFISPYGSMLSIINSLQSTNQTKRKECFNQDLGLPYTPKGSKMTTAHLQACVRPYLASSTKPDNVGHAVMGIDLGSVFNVIIRGTYDEDGARPLLYAGIITSFSEASQLMERYNIACCVVDALPYTLKAREFQEEHPQHTVWLAYYDLDHKSARELNWDYRKRAVHMDRTRTLEKMYDRFFRQENTLYGSSSEIKDYFKQLQNLTRAAILNKLGVTVMRYIKTGSDHYPHAENYCMAASTRMMGWSRS